MALNWNFETDYVGTWTENDGEHEWTYKLYSGNALLIMCAEWEKDGEQLYSVHGFFVDKDHMKRCLGLVKGTDNIYSSKRLTVELKSSYRHSKDIATALIKAKFDDDISITLKMIPF